MTRVTPYAEPSAAKLPRYTVADPYLRFWLRFVQSGTEMIARGRGDLAAARVLEGWSEYRGRAIEPLIRESIERMLPHPVLGDASVAGSYWTKDNRTAVDIVGGRETLRARVVDFVGSIKWRERAPFDRHDLLALADARAGSRCRTADNARRRLPVGVRDGRPGRCD